MKCPEHVHALHFYMKYDVTLMSYVRHSGLNGRKASDWLRPNPWLESGFSLKLFAPFSE